MSTYAKKTTIKSLLVVSLSTLLLSCNQNDELTSKNELDTKLEDALVTASKGVGKSYYTFPESDEYSKIPQDPNNPITTAKVELGKMLFHETGIAQNPLHAEGLQTYSCASCHHAKAGFQACVAQGIGEGGSGFGVQGETRKVASTYTANSIDIQPIRSPSALNVAYQNLMLWNGQFGAKGKNIGTQTSWTRGTPKEANFKGYEGIETQAIAGRDVHRLLIDKIFVNNVGNYRDLFIKAYGAASVIDDPATLAINGSLAIAAYERTLLATQAPFQQWLKGKSAALTENQKKGAIVFFGKGECATCHNGPSLANMDFYALGMNNLKNGNYGNSSVVGVSATTAEHKGRGGFTGRAEDMYKFKTPQLYNLKDSPFYGHGASFSSLEAVLKYKNAAVAENSAVPASQLAKEFKPLNLTSEEISQLTDFIKEGLRDPNLQRYVPNKLPSGLAFPNNDAQSRKDLGY